MREEDIVNRGHRAKRLLTDEDAQQAFADISADLFAEWQNARDEQARESLHAAFRGVQRFRNKLQSWADELAHRNIE